MQNLFRQRTDVEQTTKKRILRASLILIVVVLVLALDQGSKQFAVQNLKGQEARDFFGGILVVTFIENEGAFLGMLSDLAKPIKDLVLIYVPLLFCAAALIYLLFKPGLSLALSLLAASVIGGGLGNLIDRLLYGKVVDFLNFGLGSLRTGVLNIADVFVFFGSILLILFFMPNKKTQPPKKEDAKTEPPASPDDKQGEGGAV